MKYEIRPLFRLTKNNDICSVLKTKHLLTDSYKLQGQRKLLVSELK
ncbi:MAG: hypothetical protein RLZZ337_1134, partial [Bacteroidota bacterium]